MVVDCRRVALIGVVKSRSPDAGQPIPHRDAGPSTFCMEKETLNGVLKRNKLISVQNETRLRSGGRRCCLKVRLDRNLEIPIHACAGRSSYLAALSTAPTLHSSAAPGAASLHRNAWCYFTITVWLSSRRWQLGQQVSPLRGLLYMDSHEPCSARKLILILF